MLNHAAAIAKNGKPPANIEQKLTLDKNIVEMSEARVEKIINSNAPKIFRTPTYLPLRWKTLNA